MNLLCPNCQKMLTVPEQSAGQMMRCPLCSGTFTVPALPQTQGVAVGAAPAMGTGTAASSVPPPQEDVFRLATPPEPPAPARREEPAALSAWPEPSRPAEPPLPPPTNGDTGYTLRLNPHVVPWIAPAALGLVFVLLFFPWSGTLVWGEKLEWYTLSGWSTSFSGAFGILHVLLLLFALPLSVAVVALPIFGVNLPAQLDQIWPWRFALVTGLVTAATLFLILALLTGTALDHRLETISKNPEQSKDDDLAKKLRTVEQREYAKATIYYTTWLRLAVVCHFVALAGLGLQYWLERRGNKPLPRIDLVW